MWKKSPPGVISALGAELISSSLLCGCLDVRPLRVWRVPFPELAAVGGAVGAAIAGAMFPKYADTDESRGRLYETRASAFFHRSQSDMRTMSFSLAWSTTFPSLRTSYDV